MPPPAHDHTLPDGLKRFVAEKLDSLEELDVLVAVGRAGRFLSAGDLAVDLGLGAAAVEQALEALAGRGLLEVRLGTTVLYRYAPATPDLAVAPLLADHYAAACRALTARRRSLLAFAKAFKFGRRPPGDEP